MAEHIVSLNPNDMSEGGGGPFGKDLTIQQARAVVWDYDGKGVKSTFARFTLRDADGQLWVQHYTVGGGMDRFVPSVDGKGIAAIREGDLLNKNSNFGFLLSNFVNAGYPVNRISSDLSAFEGVSARWDGAPEPKREGLRGADGKQKTILVPTTIHSLPGETTEVSGAASNTLVDDAMNLLDKALTTNSVVLRRQLVGDAYSSGHPQPQAVAGVIYEKDFESAVAAKGYKINGEEISK
jgi:hypothetical protein